MDNFIEEIQFIEAIDEPEPVPPVPPLDPKTIPNLVLWLDAADSATIIRDGSNKVSAWNDKSGGAQNRLQTDANKQPLYVASSPISSKPAIKFAPGAAAATDNFLGTNSSTINPRGDLTTFTAFRIVNHSAWGHLYSMAHSSIDGMGAPGLGYDNAVNTSLMVYNSALTATTKIVLPTGAGVAGTNNVASYRRAGGNNGNGGAVSLQSRGGAPAVASGTQSWISYDGDNYYIGKLGANAGTFRTIDGYIAEHLCYERALTTEEINKVFEYLQNKWDI